MTAATRKFGQKESRPLPLWNGVFEHYDRIGDALWEFAWCIDAVTVEHDGIGRVLGGKPVKVNEIAAALKGSHPETVRRHLNSLEDAGYIRRRRTPYGHVIEVLNSRKFGIWRPWNEKPQNAVSLPPEKPQKVVSLPLEKHIHVDEKHKSVDYKEDPAVTQQKRQEPAAPVLATCWRVLGLNMPIGDVRFQGEWEAFYGQHSNKPAVDAMEEFIQYRQGRAQKIPPPFYAAKREMEKMDKEVVEAQAQVKKAVVKELEDAPWITQAKSN